MVNCSRNMKVLVAKFIFMHIFATRSTINASDTFHVRQFHGRCLEFRALKLVFSSICRDHFRWKRGERLIHVPTNKCLVPLSNNDGSILNLTSSCSGTDTLFQYQARSHSIKHMASQKCIRPEGNVYSPADNAKVVLWSGCYSKRARFWFLPQVLYVIRHFSGLCWKYNASDNLIKLANSYVCDRFLQKNNKHLKHFASGKCVILQNSYLRLTSDCTNPATLFDFDSNNVLQQTTSNRCVHPYLGSISPASGTRLVLHGCANEDRIRTYFYDDRYILKANIISESCDELPNPTTADCTIAKGHITVNGYQYSLSTRGINAVVFDYRSGILEHRSTFDVLASSPRQDRLASFLNNLPADKILFMSVHDAVMMNNNLALALQKYGISATFATVNIPKVRCSLASISYTGKNRKSWEKSVNQLNCIGMSTIQQTINVFHDLKGIDDCSEEMGLRTGTMPDSKITATSNYGLEHESYQSRLHKYSPGWCASSGAPLSHYLQVDFGAKQLLTGLAIQGHGMHPNWHTVTKFSIQYSLNGTHWKYYVDELNKKVIFKGAERLFHGETRVNWFKRTHVRFIRVIPVARDAEHQSSHCIRMELFGCSPKGPIFNQKGYEGKSEYIMEQSIDEISFMSITPLSKKIQVSISTAATNTTLAYDIDQHHICSVMKSTSMNNGTAIKDAAKIKREKNKTRGLTRSIKIDYSFKDVDYYDLDIIINRKIVDTEFDSGTKWNVYTFETEENIFMIGHSLVIKRRLDDKSLLDFNIIKKSKIEYRNGDELRFNISLAHLPDASYANAYNLDFLVYYDSTYLTLTSVSNIIKDNFTISPTKNTTTPGIMRFQTDTLWLLNNHFIHFNFKFNFPKQLFKRNNCNGAVIVDFAYTTNLAKFHGNVTTSLGKQVPYKCKISKTRSLVTTSKRITVPGFSILFDDFNNDVFICRNGIKYSERNLPSCFVQRSGNISWHGIPNISSVIGIDTSKRMLFGLDPKGNGYVKLDNNLQRAMHVEDGEWISIQNQPYVRKAKTATDVTSLPSALNNAWMFPATITKLWVATKNKLLKKLAGKWKVVINW